MSEKTKKKIWLPILVIIGLFIAIQSTGWIKTSKYFINKITDPSAKQAQKAALSWYSLINYRSIAAENNRLKDELGRLSVDFVKLSGLEKENDYLKKELGLLKTKKYDYAMASVIGRQIGNDQIIILDKGSNDGITAGQPTIANQGVIVGKILRVEQNRSFLELLTSPESQLAAALAQTSGTSGLIKGKIGNYLVMEQIPQSQQIKNGDLIITSGLEEKVPRGFLVGSVAQVEGVSGQIFKTAGIAPAFSYQNLQFLTIIKGY